MSLSLLLAIPDYAIPFLTIPDNAIPFLTIPDCAIPCFWTYPFTPRLFESIPIL